MMSHKASTVRAAALRRSAFSFANACSIGLKSGEYGGRYSSVAPAASMASRTPRNLVAAKIVHDHDVAAAQTGNEKLADIGEEALAVDRPVQHQRRDQTILAQSGDEGGGLAMTIGDRRDNAFAAPGPAVATGHVGRGGRFVDEHQLGRVQIALHRSPGGARRGYVGAVLLGRPDLLFLASPRAA